MKIRIYSLLLCGFALGSLSALAQQSPLLEKYRTMALDYNHDLKAAEKNIAASMELWWFSFHSATGLYRRTSTGIHPYGTTSAIICRQSGKGIE